MRPTNQLDLPNGLTRASARRIALDLATVRGQAMRDAAAHAAERVHPGWVDMAVAALGAWAREQCGPFSIEQARTAIADRLPPPPDLRVWGKVTSQAARDGVIRQVPRLFISAASSNGCPKPAWRKGPQA